MTFSELNQIRLALKMLFSNYYWFDGIDLIMKNNSLVFNIGTRGNVDIKKFLPKKYKNIPFIITHHS